MPTIDRRVDVSPNEGLHEYGDVEFADPGNKKYAGHYGEADSRLVELYQP
jgi:hypothetical protein